MIYPKHIALIPDGNRTWAKENGFSSIAGHLEGLNRVVEIIKYTFTNTNVEVFTTWGLSTENLKGRTKDELDYLFDLYKLFEEKLGTFLKDNKINFRWVGNESGLPQNLLNYFNTKQQELKFNSNKYLVICVNYGGKDELVRGFKKYICDNKDKKIEDLLLGINEESIDTKLDFYGLPNVELVIRTKGKLAKRLSGFMLWSIGYAQLYFEDLKCPEYQIEDYQKALNWFDEVSVYRNDGK